MNSRYAAIEEQLEKDWTGVKMVCVDDTFSDEQIATCNSLPVRGHVYTIRAIRIACRVGDNPDVALLFAEIVNRRLIYGKEPALESPI